MFGAFRVYELRDVGCRVYRRVGFRVVVSGGLGVMDV